MSIVSTLSKIFEELNKCIDCPCAEDVKKMLEILLNELKSIINDLVRLEESLISITGVLYRHFISDGSPRMVDLDKLVSESDEVELRVLSRFVGKMLISGYELRRVNGRLYLVKQEDDR